MHNSGVNVQKIVDLFKKICTYHIFLVILHPNLVRQ